MKKLIQLFSYACIALCISLSASAQKGFKKSKSGLRYKIYTKSKGASPKVGDVVFLNIAYTNAKDSMIFSSWVNGSELTFKAEAPKFKGDLNDGLFLMKEGDSAQFYISADSLFTKTFNQALPSYFNKGDLAHFFVKLNRVTTEEQLIKEKEEKEAKLKGNEDKNIELYIKENNLKAEQFPSGLRVVKTVTTNESYPTNGKKVTVHYTGKLLDGTKFDSSVDRNEPFQFTLGVGQVIKGWDEGIAKLKKGEKGLLIIPSAIGYGARGAGKVIKPYSTLVFEVELIDFEQ